ncbi:hypothetical protein ACMHYJ_14260 [Castellaniella hirudinis]|uniref:hypothetical protein n=1 Tax=Castellaniella hirudinis TaxID=1144617 RepID=UPI0039C49F51
MSKIQAPEPVAAVCHDYDLFFMGGGPIADLVKRLDVKVGDWLITTTQAEAYAAARVAAALEKAARACESRIRTGDPGIDTTDVDIEAVACAAAVRNLISSDEYQSDVQAAAGGLTQTPLEY